VSKPADNSHHLLRRGVSGHGSSRAIKLRAPSSFGRSAVCLLPGARCWRWLSTENIEWHLSEDRREHSSCALVAEFLPLCQSLLRRTSVHVTVHRELDHAGQSAQALCSSCLDCDSQVDISPPKNTATKGCSYLSCSVPQLDNGRTTLLEMEQISDQMSSQPYSHE
jgi:hypothetical protein